MLSLKNYEPLDSAQIYFRVVSWEPVLTPVMAFTISMPTVPRPKTQ